MTNRRRLIVILLLLCAPATARAQAPAGFDRAWQSVAAAWDALLDREGVIGGSLMFVHGDSMLGQEHHGFADLATRRPPDDRTIYH